MDRTRGLAQLKETTSFLYKLREEKRKFDVYYNKANKKYTTDISNTFFSMFPKGTHKEQIVLDEGVEFYDNPIVLTVNRIQSQKIIWSLDNLRKKVPKSLFKTFVNKTYTINNPKAFMAYMKQLGADPKKVKSFIQIDEELNESALNELYETGKLTLDDVEGCYTIKVNEPFIKLSEIK